MNLSLYQIESALLARLAAKCAPGTRLLGTIDPADLTDDITDPVAGKLMLYRLDPTDQAGTSARIATAYAFSAYCDSARASPADQQAAFDLLEAAGNALTGWEISPGRELQILPGPETGIEENRIIRLSIAFTVPTHFVGS